MAYLLQTTSQGHSRRQIKLQPASEGVTQNVCTHTHILLLSETLTENKTLHNTIFIPCKIIILFWLVLIFSDAFYWLLFRTVRWSRLN